MYDSIQVTLCLSHFVQAPQFQLANAGFAFDYQLINVPDYMGKGETEPLPYYYQNLGEAEYLVSMYQFMRLMGYPANKITVLTTYNGQKNLLRDVIEQRCAGNPLFGRPHKVRGAEQTDVVPQGCKGQGINP